MSMEFNPYFSHVRVYLQVLATALIALLYTYFRWSLLNVKLLTFPYAVANYMTAMRLIV